MHAFELLQLKHVSAVRPIRYSYDDAAQSNHSHIWICTCVRPDARQLTLPLLLLPPPL
jgi:hypothetical protein